MIVIKISTEEFEYEHHEYERLKAILTELRYMAKNVYLKKNSVFEDYRDMAEHDMNEIIEILLALEL